MTIDQQLSAQDPQNTQFQRDLSIAHERLGDIYLRLGDTTAALQAYQASLAIAQQLSAQDPQNTQFQRDLVVSYWKLYETYQQLNDIKQALTYITLAKEQLITIQNKGTLAADDAEFIAAADNIIKQLEAEEDGAE